MPSTVWDFRKFHWPFKCAVFRVKTQALQYYMHDGPTAFRFELAGHLNREGACRLDQDWRTASSALGERRLIVDMTFVTGVDEQARALLSRWHRDGARLIANSAASRALAESILGEVIPEPPANTLFAATSGQTWLPFPSSFLWRAAILLVLATVVFPAKALPAGWPTVVEAQVGHLVVRIKPCFQEERLVQGPHRKRIVAGCGRSLSTR
jgi:hypothetical protein